MNKNKFKIIGYKSGKSLSEILVAYKEALEEARLLGVGDNELKVMHILESLLYNEDNYKDITNKYLKSGKSFDSFMEELTSGSIPQGVRPEPDISNSLGEDDDNNEISDGSYNNQVQADMDNIEGIVDNEDLL